jgi:hypothetical protein
MVAPTVRRGLSDAYGFWKTYWMLRSTSRLRVFTPGGSRSPRKAISPCQFVCSPVTQRARVVFPEPDSPTTATQELGVTASPTSCSTRADP